MLKHIFSIRWLGHRNREDGREVGLPLFEKKAKEVFTMEKQRPTKEELRYKIDEMRKVEDEYRREAFIEIYEEYVTCLEEEIKQLKTKGKTSS
jgi:hypothetical protein